MSAESTSATAPARSKSIGKAAVNEPAVHSSAADNSGNGKRMYRMSDGKMVELPPDMTAEEAAKLEADGNAAKKQLGKGPPPKPVPNVKEKAKGKEKKGKGDGKGKGKKKKGGPGGKGKAGKGKGKAGGPLGKAVIKGKVGAWLLAKGAPVLARGKAKLQQLKTNEQKHDDAATKLSQTEKAVVPPQVEGQSASNAGQVEAVDAKPAPAPSEASAKKALDDAIQENIPKNIEDVDNFRRDNKAGHMSSAAALVVQTDKNAVSGTFGDMKQQPPPTPSDVKPELLPPEEIAPATPKMNLGKDTIAPLQKEHTDVSNYTKEADSKLKEEGVTQEQLDMVDSGDLAEANKEKKGMEKKAKTEPAAVRQFAQQANKKVDTELQQEEAQGRDQIRNQRKQKLSSTKGKQQDTKTAIEKKREEVANKINDIYKRAQEKVTKKLADLETVAIKRFDDGNAKATKQFEDTVKRELDAFKSDRYSGFWGWARKAKDWLLGMEDLPRVKAIFENNRAIFVNTIGKLVDDITLDNKKTIQECKDELTAARKEIKDYVDKLGPDLKDAGKKAQDEMNSQLDELDKFVNKKEEELQNKLKDKQQAAIKAIDEKIEKMKEAMSGALSKLGKLLLLAAKKFFSWALEKFGFSLAEIDSIINKGAAVLKAIFTQPIKFVKNLMNAAITGFQNFGKNFLKHLKDALFEWLTGSLEGLILPKTWNLQGIIGVALQMIGISYQNIRKHMVTLMGEKAVSGLEQTFTLVKTLITEGPMAAWEQLKELAGEMSDAFVDAVKDFIKMKIVEQAVQWLVGLFIPGAGIIKAIVGIYDTIVFFIKKAKQIMQMVGNFLGSIAEIAAGNIGAAADAMENGLARGLSLVISFLAQLLHMTGITEKIKSAIQKIRAKVEGAMIKVAKWIAEKAKKIWGNVKSGVQGALDWAFARKKFTLKNGEAHTLFVEEMQGRPTLMIASQKQPFSQYLANLTVPASDAAKTDAKKKAINSSGAVNTELANLKTMEATFGARPTSTQTGQLNQKQQTIRGHYDVLSDSVKILGIGNTREETVLTKIDPAGGSKLTGIAARPLTALRGNTTGNPNAQNEKNVPGWSVLDGINATRNNDRTIYNDWVRMHLVHSSLHGEAKAYNLVAAPRTFNSSVYDKVESPAIRAVLEPGAILHYSVAIEYGNAAPVQDFPTKITYSWGKLKRNDDGTFAEDGTAKSYGGQTLQPPQVTPSSGPPTYILKNMGRPHMVKILKMHEDPAERISAATTAYPEKTVYDAMDAYYAEPDSIFRYKKTQYGRYLAGDKAEVAATVARHTGTYIIDLT